MLKKTLFLIACSLCLSSCATVSYETSEGKATVFEWAMELGIASKTPTPVNTSSSKEDSVKKTYKKADWLHSASYVKSETIVSDINRQTKVRKSWHDGSWFGTGNVNYGNSWFTR